MNTLAMEISTRASQLTPSLTLSIDSKAKAMKSEGIDVCGFGAGEPDFDTPDHIKAAAIAALEAGFTKYTPSGGLPELRQAIAEKLEAVNWIDGMAGTVAKRPTASVAHRISHRTTLGQLDWRRRVVEVIVHAAPPVTAVGRTSSCTKLGSAARGVIGVGC